MGKTKQINFQSIRPKLSETFQPPLPSSKLKSNKSTTKMYSAKFISAIAAISAQAQIVPGDDGRIFSVTLDDVNIDTILANAIGNGDSDIAVSGDDYFDNINNAIGEAFEAPEYVYEDVGPNDDSLPDYMFSYGDYDGTANESFQVSASASADAEAGDQTRNLNTGINKPADWDTATGYNRCRVCNGETATDCQASDTFETCNDAQDACQVTIRSQKIGNNVEAKFYSGCKQLAACNADYGNNFFSTDTVPEMKRPMTIHDLCKSSTLPARFYRVSECTFCKKMASSADTNSQLFGTSTTQMYTHTDESDVEQSVEFSDLLEDPREHMTDFFAQNDFYPL